MRGIVGYFINRIVAFTTDVRAFICKPQTSTSDSGSHSYRYFRFGFRVRFRLNWEWTWEHSGDREWEVEGVFSGSVCGCILSQAVIQLFVIAATTRQSSLQFLALWCWFCFFFGHERRGTRVRVECLLAEVLVTGCCAIQMQSMQKLHTN